MPRSWTTRRRATRSARRGGQSFSAPATHRDDSSARQVVVPLKWVAPQVPDNVLDGFCPEPLQEEEFAFHSSGLMLFLRLADIEWLEEADGRVAVHVGKETYLLPESLAVVAAKLPPRRFIRITPSTVVNVQQIKEVQRTPRGRCAVVLRNGTRLTFRGSCPLSEDPR